MNELGYHLSSTISFFLTNRAGVGDVITAVSSDVAVEITKAGGWTSGTETSRATGVVASAYTRAFERRIRKMMTQIDKIDVLHITRDDQDNWFQCMSSGFVSAVCDDCPICVPPEGSID